MRLQAISEQDRGDMNPTNLGALLRRFCANAAEVTTVYTVILAARDSLDEGSTQRETLTQVLTGFGSMPLPDAGGDSRREH
jgi:hypothetical protein